jgi:hypothetical protein
MPTSSSIPAGTVRFDCWLVAAPPRDFTSKKSGALLTIVELRNPQNLGNSVVFFADGAVGRLASVPAGQVVSVPADEVAGGRNRGELTGRITRPALEAALLVVT